MTGNAGDRVAKELAILPDRPARSPKGSASFEPRRRSLQPAGSDEVAQWLRHSRNLRRAIVLATILGPPSQ